MTLGQGGPGAGADLRRELARKAFHLLSLVYLAAYRLLGVPDVLWALGAWIALEGSVEAARLRSPALNGLLMRLFGGVHREDEARRVSGIFWTSLGAWLAFALYGAHQRAATAALLYLAFGDAAAAIGGKAFGRTPIPVPGRRKTLEGSLSCLAVCLLLGWVAGLGPAALLAGAVAAAAVELAQPPPDDNLWIPVASGLAVWLCQ